MNPISAFLIQNIVAVYFLYGLAFFVMGLALFLAGRRQSQFKFVRAIPALAAFGIIHGAHEWYEMFQQMAKLTSGHVPSPAEEIFRLVILAMSFLALLAFGILLLRPVIERPRQLIFPLLGLSALWLAGIAAAALILKTSIDQSIVIADVLARYCLAIPGAILGGWALMVQQRTFREHAMPQFGRDLVWCATALILYGVVGQSFVRPSPLVPSNIFNSNLFMQWFGIPVQLFRGVNATILAIFMVRALKAFELESQQQLETTNEDLRLATQELSLLLDLSNLLEAPVSLKNRLNNALQQIVQTLQFPDAGVIILINRQTSQTEERALAGFSPYSNSRKDLALELGRQCVAKGMALCRHLDGALVEFLPEEMAEQAKCQAMTSPVCTISVPLNARQQVIGSIVLDQSQKNGELGLSFDEFTIILGAAQQLGMSIENARLRQDAEEREKRLAILLRQTVDAQEAERQRIALELHDATGQSLTAIALGLRGVESVLKTDPPTAINQIQQLTSIGTDALGELRQIIADLRPSQLDDLGLVAAIQWYTQEFEQRYGIATELIVEGKQQRLPSEYETVLFRIMQEGLTNVAKHAQAEKATIQLIYAPRHLALVIHDDGQGFDPKTALKRNKPAGWGLLGIQERALLLGGRCEINSTPGQGTQIIISIPLSAEVQDVQDSTTAG